MKKIFSFVITGGPCSGKTTAMSILHQRLSDLGYYVLIIPETATELISTGIRPFNNSLDIVQFQHAVLESQLNKEKLYKKVANLIPSDKIVILHDRGIIDNKSYVTDDEFTKILEAFSLNESEARDRYDAVFHLVTAANGAEEFYTLDNNSARTESPEDARKLDMRGISNWTGHPHLRVIDNSTNFKEKMERLLTEIYSVLGEPIPLEIERKYLIEKPSLEMLSKYTTFTLVDIVQTYLKSGGDNETRIRQRGQNGHFSYYYTKKRIISDTNRIEIERKISNDEYVRYLTEIDPSRSPVVKKRLCFVYMGQYFELDLFDFCDDMALMEIELTNEEDRVTLPPFIKVIKEVTGDTKYANHTIAKSMKIAP